MSIEFIKRIDNCFNVVELQKEAKVIARILSQYKSCKNEEFLLMLSKLSYIHQRIVFVLNSTKTRV
ncbi:hypothetical protein ADA01nite_11310 [Aneurinibacillus danicus]|jgi:hypothetical protein|uniref:Uncharacterized protein n=1 Tax=Aneurinibacillus danicus TaxID=267746 RepID=A0A511V686_9BACL|nr:hypothetical protein ADA01nite_11310 [Aneurinibacillus danicus]